MGGGCRGGLSAFLFGCRLLPSSFPLLSRPRLAEARRVRAVELSGDGVSNAEVVRAVGVCAGSVRRWWRVGEQGGTSALRRRAATGRPPRPDDAQVEMVRAALGQGARAHGFEAGLWTLERVGAVMTAATGVVLSRASVRRLLTGRPGWSLQRPEQRAVERDESETARWIVHEWPRSKKGAVHPRAWIVFLGESGVSLLPSGSPHLLAPRADSAPAAPPELEARVDGRDLGSPLHRHPDPHRPAALQQRMAGTGRHRGELPRAPRAQARQPHRAWTATSTTAPAA